MFVADFLGISNLMDAPVAGACAGGCEVAIGDFTLTARLRRHRPPAAPSRSSPGPSG